MTLLAAVLTIFKVVFWLCLIAVADPRCVALRDD
jgi:hypothetical protein